MFSRMIRARGFAAVVAFGTGSAFAMKHGVMKETSAFTLSDLWGGASIDKEMVKNIRASVEQILEDNPELGPTMVRLAWHTSGTYNKATGDGGNHGTMDMKPESTDPANAGLHIARARLAPVLAQNPGISKADLWVLAALVTISEMGGPTIPFYFGRTDATKCPPTGRLPDATQGTDHIRAVFTGQYGFNDQEIVALMGAHALGRCHPDRSGFDGPWTNDPYGFSNGFFVELSTKTWVPKITSTGKKQFEDTETRKLMMLPTDIAMTKDEKFNAWVKKYADDNDLFCDDFSKAFVKLTNLSWTGLKGPVTDY